MGLLQQVAQPGAKDLWTLAHFLDVTHPDTLVTRRKALGIRPGGGVQSSEDVGRDDQGVDRQVWAAARPASVMRPSWINRRARSLFNSVQ
ncbi:hypothetical protein [Deinococcus sp. Arct2-2]|uniref:hypothetical protein n=1 Tax=Deinococcus sp. Arct2-2 TaxID=2568653 RepID=UPI001454D5BD|nr:hypothetical protein [Deinococcus sp. Arct2-2]